MPLYNLSDTESLRGMFYIEVVLLVAYLEFTQKTPYIYIYIYNIVAI